MARGRKGHPVPVTLARMIVTDVVMCELFALIGGVPMLLFLYARSQQLDLPGLLIFGALGLALFWLLIELAKPLRGRIKSLEGWIREGYALAKARPCLQVNPDRLGTLRTFLSGMVALPFMVSFVLLFRLPLIDLAVETAEFGSTFTFALIGMCILVVGVPILVTIWRVSVYLSVNLLERLGR